MHIAAIGGATRTESRSIVSDAQGWRRCDAVIDLSRDAIHIALAFFLDGKKGRTWIDDMSFEIVDNSVAFTRLSEPGPELENDRCGSLTPAPVMTHYRS